MMPIIRDLSIAPSGASSRRVYVVEKALLKLYWSYYISIMFLMNSVFFLDKAVFYEPHRCFRETRKKEKKKKERKKKLCRSTVSGIILAKKKKNAES